MAAFLKLLLFYCFIFISPVYSSSKTDSCPKALTELPLDESQKGFLQGIDYTVISKFNKEKIMLHITSGKTKFLYIDVGYENYYTSYTIWLQKIHAAILLSSEVPVSIAVFPDSTDINKEMIPIFSKLHKDLKPPPRIINWENIEVRSDDFSFHLSKAYENDRKTIFLLNEGKLKKLLSSLDKKSSSELKEKLASVYVSSIHLMEASNSRAFSQFIENLSDSTILIATTVSKKPESEPIDDRLIPGEIAGTWRSRSRLPNKKQKNYCSFQRALEIQKQYKITSRRHYLEVRELHPELNLPPFPESYYSLEWKGWLKFLGKKTHYSYTEAKQLIRDLKVTDMTGYNKVRANKELPKLLPTKPHTFYEEWVGERYFFYQKPRIHY